MNESKTFDDALAAAFEAGYELGCDHEAYGARGVGPYESNVPEFPQWRAEFGGLA